MRKDDWKFGDIVRYGLSDRTDASLIMVLAPWGKEAFLSFNIKGHPLDEAPGPRHKSYWKLLDGEPIDE